MADIVKVSDEDLDWIANGEPFTHLIENWLNGATNVLLLTQGENGVTAFTNSGSINHPAMNVEVVDTIGAGDTFNAGFIAGLRRTNLLAKKSLSGITPTAIEPALELATKVAAYTFSKSYPDTRMMGVLL
ncbi:Fructokinase [Nymphon striatum]|nr:Fructokinase [Nymphon striatum]